MAKKRGQKRKSEVKLEKPEENHNEEIRNGDTSSNSTNKKKKSSVRNETQNNTPVSISKKKDNAKVKSDEDSTDYEVLKIVGVRYTKSNKRQFLIRWKNYSPQHDSWEPEENLSCDELISKFLAEDEKRSKEAKQLRKKPAAVQLFACPGNRRSKRTGGSRKNYIEAEDGEED